MDTDVYKFDSEDYILEFNELFLTIYKEKFCQVTRVFEDITYHQSSGRFPRVGDIVVIVEQSPRHVFAISNDESYSAFFDRRTHLKDLDS